MYQTWRKSSWKYSRSTIEDGVAETTKRLRQNCKKSLGKDTMTGHWEIMGLNTEPLIPSWNGFPEEIITKIVEFSGRVGSFVLTSLLAPAPAVISLWVAKWKLVSWLFIHQQTLCFKSLLTKISFLDVPHLWTARSITLERPALLVGLLLVLMLENQETSHVRLTVGTSGCFTIAPTGLTSWTKLVSIPMQLEGRSTISSI